MASSGFSYRGKAGVEERKKQLCGAGDFDGWTGAERYDTTFVGIFLQLSEVFRVHTAPDLSIKLGHSGRSNEIVRNL